MSRRAMWLLVAGLQAGVLAESAAQSEWTAQLAVDPYPSPYLSDWETNPTISTLTVTNPTGQDRPVSLVYRVTDHQGLVLASGRSDPLVLRPGPTAFTSFVDISGTSSHDAALESQMQRTGRLPEGEYTVCVVAADAGGFVLAEVCENFAIVYPDPPLLIAPDDDEDVTSPNPAFQWTPLQVPVGYRVQYVLRDAEVLTHQTPDEALRSNIPLYENNDVGAPNVQYPIEAPPLETGKTYAWRVLALDQNGYPPSANGGMSEVRTFRYDPEAVNPQGPITEFSVNVTFFDPSGPPPALWAVLDTASFAQAVAYFQSEIRDGVLDIPLPMLPSLLGTQLSAGDPESRKARGDGPAGSRSAAIMDCSKFSGTKGLFGFDAAKGAITAGFAFEPGSTPFLDCVGMPEWMSPSVGQSLSLLLAIQYKSGGIPFVTLGIKPPLLGWLSGLGIQMRYAVFVANLTRDFKISSRDLPDNVHDFYGDFEIPIWGQGQDDLVKNLVGAIKARSVKSALKMLGFNFYGVVDVASSPFFQTVFDLMCLTPVAAVCASDDRITLRGFAGNHGHGSTFRGFSLAADSGLAAAGLVKGENWGLWASIKTMPPAWPSGLTALVTDRELQYELVSLDISGSTQLTLGGEAPQRTKIRLSIRDVMKGFDSWKSFLHVKRDAADADTTLAFYSELRAELTKARSDTTITVDTVFVRAERSNAFQGKTSHPDRPAPEMLEHTDTTIKRDSTTWWSRLRFSLAWGMKATLQFGDHFRLFNPELRLMRSDPNASVLSNPLKNATVALQAGWGLANLGSVGDIDELGVFIVEFGTKQRRTTKTTPKVDLTPGKEHVSEETTVTSRTRPHFKITARLSQDAALEKLIELLTSLVPGMHE